MCDTPRVASAVPFADERYISLETFKRDGTGVKTPVWAAPLDGALVIVTGGDSFKVKRLRRDPHTRVAACNARGSVRGDWREATGRVIDGAEHVARAHAALREKYGWQMIALDFFATIGRRRSKRAFLEVTFVGAAGS